MEIKIEVNETKFKEVLENELKAFSKEELHEILRDCLIEYLRKEDVIEKLIYRTQCRYDTHKEPSDLLIQAAKTIDLSPAFEEIREKMVKDLKENYRDILESALLKAIQSTMINDNYLLTQSIITAIDDITRRNNQ